MSFGENYSYIKLLIRGVYESYLSFEMICQNGLS